MTYTMVVGLAFVSSLAGASLPFHVRDSEIRVILQDGRSAVRLPLRNSSGVTRGASLELEWLTTAGAAVARLERRIEAPPGESGPVIDFPLPEKSKEDKIWYRLRYRLRADGAEEGGTIALANSADHVFELQVSAPGAARPGGKFGVRVNTRHPISETPVGGVQVRATLDLESGAVEARGVSDASGNATLEFAIPDGGSDEDADLSVEAATGDFSQSTRATVKFDRQVQIRIDTDKPLYQPGQTMHVRLLARNSSGRASGELPVTVRVEDPEDTAAHIRRVVTNRFGVAAIDWQIPGNTRLGDYRIHVRTDREEAETETSRKVKISRYDLPNFTVTAKADRAYYLPKQDAVIEVHADYLFGKPVARGRVRVVHETQREWNYRLQKWEIDEDEGVEGLADSSGRFVARIGLAEFHEKLASGSGHAFEDATFTAYVEDPASGRTEQRRFDIRITAEPIHLYLSQSRDRRVGYVSASYADGTPAVCRIRVNESATVTTNRYGLVRVAIPDDAKSIELAAVDHRGLRGHYEEVQYGRGSGGPRLRVETNKTLYRPGETVRVRVVSSEPVQGAVLEVLRDDQVLESAWLDLRSGAANVELPWRETFVHEITIGAAVSGDYDDSASRTVLFPADRNLKVSVRMDRGEYRPGAEATATLTALSPSGEPVAAALGVSVVDAAVGERARSDGESGNRFSNWVGWELFHPGPESLAGISREDLYRLDTTKPFASDIDLLAEAMLAQEFYRPNIERSVNYREDLAGEYQQYFRDQFKSSLALLTAWYQKDYHHPRDLQTLVRDLQEAQVDFPALRDPWEQPYRVVFRTVRRADEIEILSAGPDRQFGTADDLTVLTVERESFKPFQDRITAALRALGAYPATEAGTRTALNASGIRLEELKDPWGTAYQLRFEIARERAVLHFRSAGPDRTFGTSDDFPVADISGPYFAAVERKLSALIAAQKSFPPDEDTWNQLLRSAGLFPLRDPWGTNIYPVFRKRAQQADLRRSYMAAQYGGKTEERTEILPATETAHSLYLRSAGPDRKVGTKDDFDLATYSRTEKVELPGAARAPVRTKGRGTRETTGSIVGKVTDVMGSAVASATIRAVQAGAGPTASLEYREKSDGRGHYELGGLLPGLYDVRIESPGFQMFLMSSVPVNRGKSTVVDARLNVGSVSETVTVTAQAAEMLPMASTSMVQSAAGAPQATPRLREYFPETLLWAPLVETGRDGTTQVKFRLADNITTWKLEAIGSTETGEMGTAAVDVRAFQPFFVDHDPPRVLTQGDELQLPATIRNYTEREQSVNVSLRPEKWFDVTGKNEREVRVAAGASVNTVFPIRATAAVTDGKQRITATSEGPGDAIEKPVTVHPDGREVSETANVAMAESAALDLEIPANSIADSAQASLKIYPNLVSHVIDGIEGILRRPYGCGEQTISSTYPSLMLLTYLERLGVKEHPLRGTALRYLQSGVDRLAGYRNEDGSFTYWGRGDGDVHLTAYALTFLTQAKEYAAVDDEEIQQARAWLIHRQGKDGEWPAYGWKKEFDSHETAYQTAGIALALTGANAAQEVTRALRWVRGVAGQVDEPYLMAEIALAAQNAGQTDVMEEMLDGLRKLARREHGLIYWDMDGRTPYYGWGSAGRLETTAMAVRALASAGRAEDKAMIDSGTMFLLRNKDRYGVWYSTQATVKVLQAILTASGEAGGAAEAGPVEVLVDGKVVATVAMPGRREITGPVLFDLSKFLARGMNHISLRRPGGGDASYAQVSVSYYVPWNETQAAPPTGALRMQVAFDKTAARPGEEITCKVNAERVGSRGYGMMVGEIGLPPGVDVDRLSLEEAMTAVGYEFSQYDILPDRLVVYLWPRAGGTKFSFRFRPRMEMEAKTAASGLYDYYNPEVGVVMAPVTFQVRK